MMPNQAARRKAGSRHNTAGATGPAETLPRLAPPPDQSAIVPATLVASEAVAQLLWSKPQVQAALGISQATLDRLTAAGRFPRPVRVGRLLKWRPEDVREWVNSQAKGGAR